MNFTVVGTIPGLYNGQKSAEKFHTAPPDAIINLDIANQIVYGSNTTKFDFIHVKGDANHIDQIKNELLKSNPYYIIWEEESNNKINTMILCIILFSLSIGAILMLVTTLKSVSERTREIGVLKAIGWSNKRVMGMLLIESITQTIIAWTIAIILLLTFMTLQSDIGLLNYFKTHTNTILYFLTITLLTSLLIPITGNIIPLTYVSHLKPTKALQNE
jgi:ABC-type antimicrobial peptide transport system permease subunit